ncbi:hypothetical protein ACJMK2_007901 [Sinanodonta woodiana]|uniref:Uncharacterized protein n=2 Tax=Sinanodonta woodiana TaxID=1069815 RepID=A0ABD3VJX7_SINWO
MIEYVGVKKIKINSIHGNSKIGESYTRTDPHILQIAYEKVEKTKATKVVSNMADDDSFVVPKSGRQLHDKIYRENAKKITQRLPINNITDDILTLIGESHDNPFVQSVTMARGKQPIIILYTDFQILDF